MRRLLFALAFLAAWPVLAAEGLSAGDVAVLNVDRNTNVHDHHGKRGNVSFDANADWRVIS